MLDAVQSTTNQNQTHQQQVPFVVGSISSTINNTTKPSAKSKYWLLLCCRRWYLLLVKQLHAISTSKNIFWGSRFIRKRSYDKLTQNVSGIEEVVTDPTAGLTHFEVYQNQVGFKEATIMSAQQQQQQNNNDSSFSSSNTEDYNDADERRRRIYKNRTR